MKLYLYSPRSADPQNSPQQCPGCSQHPSPDTSSSSSGNHGGGDSPPTLSTSGSRSGRIVGFSIALVIVVLLLGLGIWLFYRRKDDRPLFPCCVGRRRRRRKETLTADAAEPPGLPMADAASRSRTSRPGSAPLSQMASTATTTTTVESVEMEKWKPSDPLSSLNDGNAPIQIHVYNEDGKRETTMRQSAAESETTSVAPRASR